MQSGGMKENASSHLFILTNAADTNLKLQIEPLIFPIKTEWGLAIEI